MAVLPTPGSPTSTGLFLVRRDRICMTRSISRVRPITGSSLRSRAAWVRFRPNWSSTVEPWLDCSRDEPVAVPAAVCSSAAWGPDRSWMTVWRTFCSSAPSFWRTWAATPSPSRINPSRMCSVPM
ncbi:MAG: hypothetical protein KatS3mg011_1008 [Acidimicrobiia bacterium]|nr:MAG: hypothetical protein KatS3mg011_1008 [Acidimicrobiia bacterium]